MKSFLGFNRPVITTMLKGIENHEILSKKEILFQIEEALKSGTDAFGFQIEMLPTAERTVSDFKDIFSAMGDKPAYITDYRRCNVNESVQSDEELTEEMLLALECGATLFDVRGDLFDPQPDEFTTDEKAVARQIELINTIHSMGKEALISTHTLQYTTPQRVLEIMKAHQDRGADISKLVASAGTREEEFQAFENLFMLSRQLKIPYLYLVNGENCSRHRRLSPSLGNCLFLCAVDGVESGTQPHMSEAKTILTNSGFADLHW